jgi:hypothetical protein
MKAFGISLFFIAFLLPIGALLYIKQDKKKMKNPKQSVINADEQQGEKLDPKQKQDLKDEIEFEKIINHEMLSVIKLYYNRYRVIFSLSTPDIELLNEGEQEAFENHLIQYGLSLNFPVLFHTTTSKVEVKEPINLLTTTIESKDDTIPKELKEYAMRLREGIKKKETSKGSYVRKSYCAIGVDDIVEEKRALHELKSRCDTVISGLSAKAKITPLDSIRSLQVFADMMNKNSITSIEKLIGNGALELYSEGLGVILNVDEEKED